jgi:hypothetical protein
MGLAALRQHGTARALWPADVIVVTGYVLASVLLYAGLWRDLDSGYLVASGQDQNLFEWLFAAQAHALRHGESPLFSDLQNARSGST